MIPYVNKGVIVRFDARVLVLSPLFVSGRDWNGILRESDKRLSYN